MTPTSAVLMGDLALSKIGCDKYIKVNALGPSSVARSNQ
jgi:uncharacterized ion transporter superfamily protein YfcC